MVCLPVAVLNSARNALSFFLLCIVCMGYGVVRPSLGSVMTRVKGLAVVHFVFGILCVLKRSSVHCQPNRPPFQLLRWNRDRPIRERRPLEYVFRKLSQEVPDVLTDLYQHSLLHGVPPGLLSHGLHDVDQCVTLSTTTALGMNQTDASAGQNSVVA